MAIHFITIILGERQSIVDPPLFNGENYPYWKIRMKFFIQANNYDVQSTIVDGPHKPTKEEKEWDTNGINMVQLNAKAMHILLYALGEKEYNRVSKCESGKEIWEKLEKLYREAKKEEKFKEKPYKGQCSTCGKAIRDEESSEIQSSIQFKSCLMALKELKIMVKITFEVDRLLQHWENKFTALVKGSSPYNFSDSSALQRRRSSTATLL
ncbi:Uncharacterized protein TCM_017644 [Theobroma cacao]|uniref:DUF4219 domain-containing protein n=1 Tax=Theobroma cacao TaxID=3641 RepID=A0A061EFH4_THECC|nr:Uncharacterized protein TCM_017644 [Theobroma cacao]